MATLNSYVSDFSDINLRVGLTLTFDDIRERPINAIIIKQVKDFIVKDELQPALVDFFMSRNETALQLTYARVIVDKLLNDWLPTITVINKKIIDLQNVKYTNVEMSETGSITSMTERDLSEPKFFAVEENLTQLWYLYADLVKYNRNIIENIRHFAPGLYNKFQYKFSEYVGFIVDEEIFNQQLADPVPQPTEPGVKLQWNGAADTLYDVFRQLKNHHLPDGSALVEDSYDKIALFIQQSFAGFDTVATSTIRGKLTKNIRPKKAFNRADLDLSEPD